LLLHENLYLEKTYISTKDCFRLFHVIKKDNEG
jgi:hypothetical protein